VLFERVALPTSTQGSLGSWWRGLRLVAIDGTVLDLPDTDPRLVELAAVYPGHYTIDEFPIGENPGMR